MCAENSDISQTEASPKIALLKTWSLLQSGAEILVDDFDPEAHAQQSLAQKAEDAKHHAARMLRQTKVTSSDYPLTEAIYFLIAHLFAHRVVNFVMVSAACSLLALVVYVSSEPRAIYKALACWLSAVSFTPHTSCRAASGLLLHGWSAAV